MADVNDCNIPEDLYYWVEQHTWVRPEDDGTVTIGITDVAQHLAGNIVALTPKGAGRTLKKGKSAGIVESGKWVGPVRTPLAGKVVAVNDEAKANPSIINDDPYGAGWIVRIDPQDWDADSADLVTGDEGTQAYQAFLDEEGISC